MLKASFYALLATIFSLSIVGATRADTSEGAATARQGVVRCGGTNFLRLNGAEIHSAHYILRNFDSTKPIVIERMRIFSASGGVLFDSADLGPLPVFQNGILGPTNNTLNPNQTANFFSESILPDLPQTNRPIQLEIEWSSNRAALTLDVSLVRISRQRDPANGNIGAERSRSIRECRSIFLK